MLKVRSQPFDVRGAIRSRVPLAAIAWLGLAGCAGAGLPQPAASTGASTGGARAQGAVAALPSAEASTDAQRTSSVDEELEPVAVPIEGTELVRGRATVVVQAPLQTVRESVLGFAGYPDFMPHYESCRVLGRTPAGARDVYMEITALHGAVKMWARVEVTKQPVQDGVETYAAKLVDGNVDDFQATWRMRKLEPQRTELSLEVFLKPKIPLPVLILNEENLKGSVKGVLAMRARAEQSRPAP